MSLVETLVERVLTNTRTEIGADERERVAQHVFDGLVLSTVGARSQEYRRTAEALGLSAVRDTPSAALMATAIRLTEADDIHLASCITPGSIVVPAAICALPGIREADSDLVIRAIRAGYDVILAVGQALDGPSLITQGIWPSYALAPLGAAVCAAVLMRLDEEQLANAIAGALDLGPVPFSIRAGAGPSMRWLGFGNAVSIGSAAARAAAAGLAADLGIPDRAVGELLMNGGSAASLELPTFTSGVFGTVGMKPYSAGRQSLAAVQAFGELLAEHSIDPRTIDHIVVAVPSNFVSFINRPAPFLDRRASLGAQYLFGLVAMYADDLNDVERARLRAEPEFERIGSVMEIVASGSLDAEYPQHWGAEVIIEAGGKRFERRVVAAHGDADDRMTWDELRRKAVAMLASGGNDAEAVADAAYRWAVNLTIPGSGVERYQVANES